MMSFLAEAIKNKPSAIFNFFRETLQLDPTTKHASPKWVLYSVAKLLLPEADPLLSLIALTTRPTLLSLNNNGSTYVLHFLHSNERSRPRPPPTKEFQRRAAIIMSAKGFLSPLSIPSPCRALCRTPIVPGTIVPAHIVSTTIDSPQL